MEIMDSIKRDPRGQGDQGEAAAIIWLLSQGAPVYLPVGNSRDVDLITVLEQRVVRIQVKTSTVFRHNRWEVTVCTRGGSRSWSGHVKYLDPAAYDALFVLVADGRQWFIPADEVDATSGLALGGPKYERFEINSGSPIRPPVAPLH